MAAFDYREASWSAVAKGQGASLCPDDTAVERRENALRPIERRPAGDSGVAPQRLPPHSTTLPRISTIND
jgi:hypothetical protein